MNHFVAEKMYKGSPALGNAMNDIDEKMKEIKEVERRVNKLYEMIKELRAIIQKQTSTLDSISANMDELHGHVTAGLKNVDEAVNLYMSAKEVVSKERMHYFLCCSHRFCVRHELFARETV